MKKIVLAALAAITLASVAGQAFAGGYHWTNGYVRDNGTWVNGYMSGNPDGQCWNNLGGC